MKRKWGTAALVVTVFSSSFVATAPADTTTVVSTCGQVVSGTAVLQADLDCSGYTGTAITVARGVLRLNGFTVTGNPALPPEPGCDDGIVVACSSGRCTLEGPGTITGGGSPPCNVGAVAFFRKVIGVTTTGNTGSGISQAVHIENSTVSANGLHGVVVGNSRTKLVGTSVSGNAGRGIEAIGARRVSLDQSQITANGGQGVFLGTGYKGKAVLRASSEVSGNSLTPAMCEAGGYVGIGCGDIVSPQPPRLDATSSCGTSLNSNIGHPWGVCTND